MKYDNTAMFYISVAHVVTIKWVLLDWNLVMLVYLNVTNRH